MPPGNHKMAASNDPTSVADRLHSAAIRVLRMVAVQDTATGIGPARLSALSVLVFSGPMSLKALAAKERVKPPTMSRVISGLEKDGLVRRRVLSADRREVRLYPTSKGTRLLQAARKRRVAFLAEMLSHISHEDRQRLARAAEMLLNLAWAAPK